MPKIALPSISQIKQDFVDFSFVEDDVFHWSPKENRIYYNPQNIEKASGIFQLLHEIGHAQLGHARFTSSIQLLKLEVAAWEKATEIATKYSLTISPNHTIQQLFGDRVDPALFVDRANNQP